MDCDRVSNFKKPTKIKVWSIQLFQGIFQGFFRMTHIGVIELGGEEERFARNTGRHRILSCLRRCRHSTRADDQWEVIAVGAQRVGPDFIDAREGNEPSNAGAINSRSSTCGVMQRIDKLPR